MALGDMLPWSSSQSIPFVTSALQGRAIPAGNDVSTRAWADLVNSGGNANFKSYVSMLNDLTGTTLTAGPVAAGQQFVNQLQTNLQPLNWGGYYGPQTTSTNSSFYQVFGAQPIFAYDSNISPEALFQANATPAMLNIYNQLPADQKRAMEVQAVLNHLEVVNQIATNFIKWNKETLMAIARNLV